MPMCEQVQPTVNVPHELTRQFSSLVLERTGMEQSSDPCDSFLLRRISGPDSLCFIRMCCLSPFTETAENSHWSHFGALATAFSPLEIRDGVLCCFFAINSSLRLAFLRSVEGLAFFLILWLVTALLLVSREKAKSGPMEREKLETWPWLASAWQKVMHLEARESSPLARVVIVEVYFWIMKFNVRTNWTDMLLVQ